MISNEMIPKSLTELHEVFERRTPSIAKHMSDVLRCLFQLALVRLSGKDDNTERKVVGRRSQEMSYRDIPLVETKN